MKLVVCSKYHFMKGGAERYFFNIQELLRAAGHEAVPFSVRFDGSLPSPYGDHFVRPPAARGGVHFRALRPTAIEKLKGALNAVYSLPARRHLSALIAQERPAAGYLLNIVNYLSPSVIDAFAAAKLPVVMRLSDYNFACARHSFFRSGENCFECRGTVWPGVKHRCVHGSLAASALRALAMQVHNTTGVYRRVDHFVAPSSRMAEELETFGVPRGKITLLPTPVSVANFTPHYDTGGHLLFVGRISPEKGVHLLLEAYRHLSAPRVPLVLIGDADEDYLRVLRSDLDQPGVEVRGPVHGSELARAYADSAIVVVPSVSHDNSPNVVLEAMATGKPVIGTRVGGIPDQIGTECGIVVEPGDAIALARAMQDLLSDGARRSAMGRAARARVELRHDPDAHVTALVGLFASLGAR